MINKLIYRYRVLGLIAFSITLLAIQNCARPLTYEGQSYLTDPDGDGVDSIYDNCPNVYNPAPQIDSDGNGIGDACDIAPVDLGTAFANAVLVSADIDSGSCQRRIVWEDLSNNESKFEIWIRYEQFEWDQNDEPSMVEYEYDIDSIYISDPSTAEQRSYIDDTPHSQMEGVYYKIITSYDDGSKKETNWLYSYDGC
ncbi:thrombospondin type 3 repeat-containing protein [bacterium]|nr:thrombospondin type 3 repeat-containing protein [bacterium]